MNPVQTDASHYKLKYDTQHRFIAYQRQIHEVFHTNPNNVLEIGIGNGTVSNYLRSNKVDVTTLDFAEDLCPDILGDVTNIPFEDNTFDTVLCAEVLEHIPFDQFETALSEIQRIARNNVVLTLPHLRIHLDLTIKLPLAQRKFLNINLPYWRKHIFDGEHYWEIGKKGYPIKTVLSTINKYFSIEKHYSLPLHHYIHFFILNKGLKS